MPATGCSFVAAYSRRRNGRSMSHEAARRAVARLLTLADAGDVEIVPQHRAPPLACRGRDGRSALLPVSVSLSHTSRLAAAVAAPQGWRVGVDVERKGSIAAADAGYFLTRRELEQLPRLGPTALWCLKEAAWKALACGPAVPFKRVELLFGPEADGRVRLVGVRDRARSWRVQARLRRLRHGQQQWIVAVVRIREELPRRRASSTRAGT